MMKSGKLPSSLAALMVCLASTLLPDSAQAAENRDTKVRNDKAQVEAGGQWIYNQFEQALVEAKRTDKPVLVTLRCIP